MSTESATQSLAAEATTNSLSNASSAYLALGDAPTGAMA